MFGTTNDTRKFLTTLRLMGDFAGMCIQLLDVVRTSPSITRLFVSDMGKYLGMNLALRPPGWSNLVDGWWYRRKPLAELHIRAALPQVVYRLGTIPASKVWLTLPKFSIKDSTFVHDEEIFPQMQNMTMMNFTPSPTPYSSINPDLLVYAQTMYTGRGVIVEGESSSTLKEVYDPTVSNYLLSSSRRT
ncbi:hypothetical protein CPB86DRAFT_306169 [Serendipita vermifera]|nr:hypothetical protein CPB86DRAFT_306169 [Serendipita vermifera]